MIDMESCPKCGWEAEDDSRAAVVNYHSPIPNNLEFPERVSVSCPRCGYTVYHKALDAKPGDK